MSERIASLRERVNCTCADEVSLFLFFVFFFARINKRTQLFDNAYVSYNAVSPSLTAGYTHLNNVQEF